MLQSEPLKTGFLIGNSSRSIEDLPVKLRFPDASLTRLSSNEYYVATGGTETDPLSLHLDQTTPQTFTGGIVTGSGLLKVTAGLLGLDTSVYLTTVDISSNTNLAATAPIVLTGDTLSHSASAGSVHLPTGGSSNQILKNSGTSGIGSWGTVTENSGALASITTLGMSGQLTNTLAIGTSPFAVTSTTVNTNLNADLLDGNHASSFISTIADPNINALFGWDDTDNAYKFLTIGSGLSYDHASHTLSSTGGSGISGSGTTTYLPKFTGSTAVGDSILFQSGNDILMNMDNGGKFYPLSSPNYHSYLGFNSAGEPRIQLVADNGVELGRYDGGNCNNIYLRTDRLRMYGAEDHQISIITGNITLGDGKRNVLADASSMTGSCSGTPSTTDCTTYSNSTDCNANNYHGGCSWVTPGNYSSCTGTETACSYANFPTPSQCTAQAGCTPAYNGDCTLLGEGACLSTSGCSTNYNPGSCSGSTGGCTTWDDCQGCGDQGSCEACGGGWTPPSFASCTGTYYDTCSGTATTCDIANFVTDTACNAQSGCAAQYTPYCTGTATCQNNVTYCAPETGCTWSLDDLIVTLPSCLGSGEIDGRQYTIKRIDGEANTVEIDVSPASGQLIDGSSSYDLTTQYQKVSMACLAGYWYII